MTAWTLLAGIRISRPWISGRIEFSRQFADDDRAFVLVAVVSAFDDDRRALAIGDDGDRNARHAPGVIMRRVRKHDPADLSALPVEVDSGKCGGGALRLAFAHCRPFMAPGVGMADLRGLDHCRVGRVNAVRRQCGAPHMREPISLALLCGATGDLTRSFAIDDRERCDDLRDMRGYRRRRSRRQGRGADRVELCADLLEGGITPSHGMIRRARTIAGIGLNVMIRPRGGDFLFDDDEFATMQSDIEIAKAEGADGVVIGLLTAAGEVDAARTRELILLARPLSVTFHRAFDMTPEPFRALETLVGLGVDRVLTSGQEASVWRGCRSSLISSIAQGTASSSCPAAESHRAMSIGSSPRRKPHEIHFAALEAGGERHAVSPPPCVHGRRTQAAGV